MRSLLLVSTLVLAAACGQSDTTSEPEAPAATATLAEADKTDIDCLSAKTVQAITDTIREGSIAGTDPAELRSVPATETGKALDQLKTKYDGADHAAYLEADISYRLDQIQNALNNRDPNSDAHQVMNGTFELAANCTFGS